MSKTTTTPEAPKTLAAALASLEEARTASTALQTELDAANSRASSAEGERESLRSQFDASVASAEALRTERDSARAELTTERDAHAATRAERDALSASAATAAASIERLEKLCNLRGIDPKAAIVSTPGGPEGAGTAEDLRMQFAEIKDPTVRAAFFKKHENAMTR